MDQPCASSPWSEGGKLRWASRFEEDLHLMIQTGTTVWEQKITQGRAGTRTQSRFPYRTPRGDVSVAFHKHDVHLVRFRGHIDGLRRRNPRPGEPYPGDRERVGRRSASQDAVLGSGFRSPAQRGRRAKTVSCGFSEGLIRVTSASNLLNGPILRQRCLGLTRPNSTEAISNPTL